MTEEKKTISARITPSSDNFLKDNNLSADAVITLYRAAREAIKNHPIISDEILPEHIIDAYLSRCEEVGCDIIRHDTTASFLMLLHPAIDACANVFAILNRSGAAGLDAIVAAEEATREVLLVLYGEGLDELPGQQRAVMEYVYFLHFMLQFFATSVVREDASKLILRDGNDRYKIYLESFLSSLTESDDAKKIRQKFDDFASKVKAVAEAKKPEREAKE